MSALTIRDDRLHRAVLGAAVGTTVGAAWVMSGMQFFHGDFSRSAILGGLIIGAVAGLYRLGPWIAWLAMPIALAVLICGFTPVIPRLTSTWVRRDSLPTRPLDAVVVLSTNVNRNGVMSQSGLERLIAGLEVMKANGARQLVTTSISNRDDRASISSDGDQRAIVSLTPDTAKWTIIGPVFTTDDEARETRALVGPAATVGVITSPMHSRRACAVFEAAGVRVVCLPSQGRSYALDALVRPRARLRAAYDYLYERLAMVKYRARGRIK